MCFLYTLDRADAAHTEPGDLFFDIPHSAPDLIRLTPLPARFASAAMSIS